MKTHKVFSFIGSLYGGGAEKLVADLSCSLNKIFNHTILVTYKSEKTYTYCGDIIAFNTKRYSFFKRILNQIKALNKLKKNNRNAVFISHLWVANMLNCFTSSNGKTIITMHGRWSITPDKGKFLDFLTSSLYQKADAVICVSEYMKKLYQEYHGDKVPIHVIYNGINHEQIIKQSEKSLKLALPKKFLVYVAGFRPVKNHLKLLENLANFLHKSDYHLVLVGDGPLRFEIETKIKNLYLNNKVILMGNCKNPHQIVSKAKFALLSSKNESFSLTLVEAMALGVPVISTDCGGPREILSPTKLEESLKYPHKENGGYLINSDLSDNIGEIINSISPEEYNQLSNTARNRSLDFTLKKTAKSYIKLIERII